VHGDVRGQVQLGDQPGVAAAAVRPERGGGVAAGRQGGAGDGDDGGRGEEADQQEGAGAEAARG